jgi:hypothetical protein
LFKHCTILKGGKYKSFNKLQEKVDQAVQLYNRHKPHNSLAYETPKSFEKKYLNLQEQTKPAMTESLDANTNYNRALSPVIIRQTKPLTPNVLSANIGVAMCTKLGIYNANPITTPSTGSVEKKQLRTKKYLQTNCPLTCARRVGQS